MDSSAHFGKRNVEQMLALLLQSSAAVFLGKLLDVWQTYYSIIMVLCHVAVGARRVSLAVVHAVYANLTWILLFEILWWCLNLPQLSMGFKWCNKAYSVYWTSCYCWCNKAGITVVTSVCTKRLQGEASQMRNNDEDWSLLKHFSGVCSKQKSVTVICDTCVVFTVELHRE